VSEFLISFDPPLPAAGTTVPPLKLDGVDVAAVVAGYPHEHHVIYSIDGRAFGYCPASILTVLNDVHLEWMLIQGRRSHDVTLAGYTVLEAVFEQGGFQFRDPRWPPAPVGDRFDAADLEDKFKAATATIWSLVCAIQHPAD
jgi:hypothetical protein